MLLLCALLLWCWGSNPGPWVCCSCHNNNVTYGSHKVSCQEPIRVPGSTNPLKGTGLSPQAKGQARGHLRPLRREEPSPPWGSQKPRDGVQGRQTDPATSTQIPGGRGGLCHSCKKQHSRSPAPPGSLGLDTSQRGAESKPAASE